MTNAELIAGYAGPVLAVTGLALLINRHALVAAIREMASSTGTIVFAGVLTLLAGLAIVRAHNVWSADWRVIVTLLGWLCVVGGVIRIVWPDRVSALRDTALGNDTRVTVWALVALALGAFLTVKGYALI